jgi:hypothetical protein
VVGAAFITVTAVAESGMLLVHSDILPTVLSSGQETDLLFQHALVNGALHMVFSADKSIPQRL